MNPASHDIEFFSVSKIENKDFIYQNYLMLQKYYPNSSYTLIAPSCSLVEFKQFFKSRAASVSILNEETYVSFKRFVSIFSDVAFSLGISKVELDKLRFGWYYQQILKLSHASCQQYKQYCVMVDADTILLRKLVFFKGITSIVYTTSYERNLPYFHFCEEVFRERLRSKWYSATTQLFSLTPSERLILLDRFDNYAPRIKSESMAEWITRLCATALFKANNSIPYMASLMSEQDIISYSNLLNSKTHKKNIFYIRSTKSFLSQGQLAFSARLGIAHVTYEQWLLDGSSQRLGFFAFMFALLKAFVPMQYKISSLLKYCKGLCKHNADVIHTKS